MAETTALNARLFSPNLKSPLRTVSTKIITDLSYLWIFLTFLVQDYKGVKGPNNAFSETTGRQHSHKYEGQYLQNTAHIFLKFNFNFQAWTCL